MKRTKALRTISLFIIPLIFGVVFVDIAGMFSYSDIPFAVTFFLYILFIIIQSIKSKTTFAITLFFFVWMGFSYVPTGASVVTERIGEWFYLFFVFGLVQYVKESWKIHDNKQKSFDESTDWNKYYMKRFRSNHMSHMKQQLERHARWYINWLGYIDTKVSIYKKSLRIFEIGSGIGGVLTLLIGRDVSIVGSDVSDKARQAFLSTNPRVPYKICDIQTSRPLGGTYDRILAFEVLEHLIKLEPSIKNIHKALRKGGYFIGTTPYPYHHVVTLPTHVNVHHPVFWKKLFYAGGFTSVVTYPMSLPPFLWRIHPKLNLVFPFYLPFSGWISTTLIIARA